MQIAEWEGARAKRGWFEIRSYFRGRAGTHSGTREGAGLEWATDCDDFLCRLRANSVERSSDSYRRFYEENQYNHGQPVGFRNIKRGVWFIKGV